MAYNLSSSENADINKAKQEWEQAKAENNTAGMKEAHDKAEAIRNNHGYSGGEDGSEYNKTQWGHQIDMNNAAADYAAEAYRQASLQGAEALKQLIPGLENQYDDVSRQAYKNYMLEQKNTNKQLSKLGLGGQGFAESTVANNSNAYQQNVNNSELAKKNAINEINSQAASVIAGGDLKASQAKADAQLQLANQFQTYLQKQQQQQNWLLQFMQTEQGNALSQNNWQQQFDQKNKTETQRNALQLAIALAKNGDFSGFKALGFDEKTMKNNFNWNLYN